MPPLHDSEFCWAHDERYAAEAAEARVAGGQVKKNQGTLRLIYDLEGIETTPDLRRWLSHAMFEMLRLPNSVPRNNGIMRGTQIAAELNEKGDHEERLQIVEGILKRQGLGPAPFAEPEQEDGA